MNIKNIKSRIRHQLINNLIKVDDVISVTLVGSFVDKQSLEGISDIDTIVICSKLTKSIFESCLQSIKLIDLKKCGLENYNLIVNTTFGPLKFNVAKQVVIHLMIYDLQSHRRHVLCSPFTCLDWERSTVNAGMSLREIFPSGLLQYRDFFEIRRSIDHYLMDLKKNAISYREYDFQDEKVFETKKTKQLDNKHKGEFAYHIIRNLISNYLKLDKIKNDYFSNHQIKIEILRLLKESASEHNHNFHLLNLVKGKTGDQYPQDANNWAELFVSDFDREVKRDWSQSTTIYFIRHLRSGLNDDTYLGQDRNPGIAEKAMSNDIDKTITRIYSSPMKRCEETANLITSSDTINIDGRLNEINYGKAEGITYHQLCEKYPNMGKKWSKGEDPAFPNGENTRDVNKRLRDFLNDLEKELKQCPKDKSAVVVVTHNVVLRCLLGKAYGLPLKEWYKLKIPYGLPIEFLYYHNQYYSNIPRPVWGEILTKIGIESE